MNIVWELNKAYSADGIMAQCHVVMDWVGSMDATAIATVSTIIEQLECEYGYPIEILNTGNIAESGVYISPYAQDPPLTPLVHGACSNGIHIYMYEYDLVAVGQELFRLS